jgi:hypothetical protein
MAGSALSHYGKRETTRDCSQACVHGTIVGTGSGVPIPCAHQLCSQSHVNRGGAFPFAGKSEILTVLSTAFRASWRTFLEIPQAKPTTSDICVPDPLFESLERFISQILSRKARVPLKKLDQFSAEVFISLSRSLTVRIEQAQQGFKRNRLCIVRRDWRIEIAH